MTGLFKVVLHSSFVDDPTNEYISVFGYRSNILVSNEEQVLADEFVNDHLPAIRNVVSINTIFKRVEVYNVTNGTGYWDKPLVPTLGGLRAGENSVKFAAWGFRYNRVTAGKRHGAKRFGNVSESDITNGAATGAVTTVLNATAVTLGSSINVGVIQTWFPEILERKPTGVYPWTSHPILNVQYVRITSQNSRKR